MQQQPQYYNNVQDQNNHQRQASFSQMNNNSVAYGFVSRGPHQQNNSYYGQNETFKDNTNGDDIDEMSQQLHQTTTQRVAAAMYPEAIDNDMDISSTQMTGNLTAVQRLAEPSQMLRHAVVNLINYQDDADLAARALPELIKLLKDTDKVVVSQAAMVVHQLSRKEASRHALSNSEPLVQTLINTLEHCNDIDTKKFASEALGSISQNNQGLLAIFKTGGIRALIHALDSPDDVVVFNALTTLHNLLLHQEGAKMNVRLNGGLQKMVSLLQRDNPKFLALVTDCLHILAFGNLEGKLIILASGGPAELVRILHSFHYEKLLFTTSRVVKVLSVCPNNKPAIILAGGMQALALCLNHPSRRLNQECLWTLRNLSDSANKETNVEQLLQRLVQFLDGNDFNFVTCAVGILSNLTCNNQANKTFVCKIGGVQAMLQTLRNYGDREEIREPAVCGLRHLTNRHSEAHFAQETIRLHGGLPDVAKLLDPPSKWPLLTATAGLVRNLALNPQNLIALRDLDMIQKLCMLLGKSIQAYQESPSDGSNLAGKIERVIESVISALHIMATDYQSRIIINGMNILITIISLLYNQNETILIATLDLLTELAREPGVASSIESQNGPQILSGLLNSSDEAIRQRAALLFSIISGDKAPEYTQRLSNEINTLFQSDPNDGYWIEAHNQDIPAVYSMEGNHLQRPSSSISATGRQQNNNTNAYSGSAYISAQDLNNHNAYGRTGHIMQEPDATLQQQQQPNQGQNEPWFDTDL